MTSTRQTARWIPGLLLAIVAGGVLAQDPQIAPEPLAVEPFFFALSVRDVEASSAWYARVLGFELVRALDLPERGTRIRILKKPGALVELVELVDAQPIAALEPPIERRFLLHGAFKVGFRVDALEATTLRLERLGVPLRGEVVTDSDGSMRSVQIEDPDANVVQLFEVL